MPGKKPNTELNLLSLIDAEGGLNCCWPFLGFITQQGYGHIRKGNRKTVKAHRWAYEYFYNTILNNQIVMHTCDNRKCCNPIHLKAGTHQENMKDMQQKGRTKKLNYEQIYKLRKNGYTHIAIAKELKCSPHTIQQILKTITKKD